MANQEVFQASRRLTMVTGLLLAVLGSLGFGLLFFEWSTRLLIAAIGLLALGALLLLSARNVSRIIVDDQSIKFLPVGAEFHFSEMQRMHVPSWADRLDTPPNALGSLTIDTNTEKFRFVPGAIIQWRNRCKLNFQGCDGNRMLSVLRRHVPE
ncbi:hypothetical protein [Sedimentitalea sp.]|uniref:hypothetical protein n=1 Tax=Sedimentitalea sp. TaxID=2048915 RepID=UPI00329A6ABE